MPVALGVLVERIVLQCHVILQRLQDIVDAVLHGGGLSCVSARIAKPLQKKLGADRRFRVDDLTHRIGEKRDVLRVSKLRCGKNGKRKFRCLISYKFSFFFAYLPQAALQVREQAPAEVPLEVQVRA